MTSLIESTTMKFEFKNFIIYLNTLKKPYKSYSTIKNLQNKEDFIKKTIILKELSQLENKNPLENIDNSFITNNFNLSNELNKVFLNNQNEELKEKLTLLIENMILNKKIIEAFLDFYISKQFEYIVQSLNKINSMRITIYSSIEIIKKLKEKRRICNDKYLLNMRNYLYKRQKKKNLSIVLSIITNINNTINIYNSNNKYRVISNKDKNEIIHNISLERLLDIQSKIKESINEFKSSKYNSKHNLIIYDNILKEVKGRIGKVSNEINLYIKAFFEYENDKSDEQSYMNFFTSYLSISNNKTELFINSVFIEFKSKVIDNIKLIFIQESDMKDILEYDISNIKDMKDLKRIKINDNNKIIYILYKILLLMCFYIKKIEILIKNHFYIKNLLTISIKDENFHYFSKKYTRIECLNNNQNVILSYFQKRKIYFELINSTLSEILSVFSDYIIRLDHRTISYFICILNCFKMYSNIIYNKEYDNYDNNKNDNNIKKENKSNINNKNLESTISILVTSHLDYWIKEYCKKINLFFTNDIWRPIKVNDLSDILKLNNISEKIPLFINKLLSINKQMNNKENKNENENENKNEFDLNVVYFETEISSIIKTLYDSCLMSNIKAEEMINSLSKKVFLNFDKKEQLFFENCFENIKETDVKRISSISSSGFSLINYFIEISSMSFLFLNTKIISSYEIFKNCLLLIDYYILSCIDAFSDKNELVNLYDDTVYNIEQLVKKPEKLDTFFEIIKFQQAHLNIKKYSTQSLFRLKERLDPLLVFPSSFVSKAKNNNGVSKLPELNTEIAIRLNNKNIYNLLIERIVAYDSIYTIASLVEKLFISLNNYHNSITLLGNIKNEMTYQNLTIEKNDLSLRIGQFKLTISQLKSLLFHKSSLNLTKSMEIYIDKAKSFKWDIVESNNFISEANSWIEDIYLDISLQYEKLDILSLGELGIFSKIAFIEILIKNILELYMFSISNIKKCSSTGRSIMLKDIKILKQKIFDLIPQLNISDIFNHIEIFINSWYYNEESLLKYLNEDHPHPKLIASIVFTGDYFGGLNKNKKKEVLRKLEEEYYKIIEELKNKYI